MRSKMFVSIHEDANSLFGVCKAMTQKRKDEKTVRLNNECPKWVRLHCFRAKLSRVLESPVKQMCIYKAGKSAELCSSVVTIPVPAHLRLIYSDAKRRKSLRFLLSPKMDAC